MANIMITEYCNLRCPYCFANEFVGGKSSNNMTIEKFRKAMDFVLTDNNNKVGIIGGEPTVHPQFKEILEILTSDERVEKVLLFTNNIFIDRYIKQLTNSKFSILINCNAPEDIGEHNFKKMVDNLDIMIHEYYMSSKITLGINMYKPCFSYDYIIELLRKYKMKCVRTSIVVPNTLELRGKNALEYFRRMKESVFEFFQELQKYFIIPKFDCNAMPLCLLSEDEIELFKSFKKIAKGHHCNLTEGSICRPVIDIAPDLSAVRCFGLSDHHKVSIEKFKNMKELIDYFYNYFDVFAYNTASAKECNNCNRRKNMECTGGCLAFKGEKIESVREYCSSLMQ
ncbi:radical SAM protein [Ruminiclostridium herbifermentans]|uniref:Radical SAM protein n=1 Tax=Ruminiclostridium herbifermentans TaxID=2488810 RepID=A0A4U7JHJ7_9FIRM|nr:radical SAM protein [Ruminiclostridium herbifermentans]QNU66181.1 radical SAM protein [Ruminiclostridium herbifermentans]